MNPKTVRRTGLVRSNPILYFFISILTGLSVSVCPVRAQEAVVTGATDEADWEWDASDPRIGLGAGLHDAAYAAANVRHLANLPKPEGFDSEQAAGGGVWNSDLAFRENHVFVGNYRGFNIYDISDPGSPQLKVSVVCPGGQGDVSVRGNLLFMSVEETRGRIDCGIEGVPQEVSSERFRGVRIFDISDIEAPRQVAAVQTCRGSHTHSLVEDPRDENSIYVYVSGTSQVRSGEELTGCSDSDPEDDPSTSYFRIEVIHVPLDAPDRAKVAGEPRVFANYETGYAAGLWRGGNHGPGTQTTSETNQCHDITVYSEIGLAGGACSGNGIILDISDPVNPVRIEEVSDPNFAYWHSATFNNDGTTVLFTDEWGGGTGARCLSTDPGKWGANAFYKLKDGKLAPAGYYKLPVPQTATENCVAHNGSLIPVPGRDIKVQAWYQGGMSIFDFTDPDHPFEIASFDRGPLSDTDLIVGGYWSTYWYNGYIYGSEIARGLDVFELTASEFLTQNEIDAARLVHLSEFNTQNQKRVTWPASFVVARAYLDQLVRAEALTTDEAEVLSEVMARAESQEAGTENQLKTIASRLETIALQSVAEGSADNSDRIRVRLANNLRGLTGLMP